MNTPEGKHSSLTDFFKYDIRQMHAAFTGTIPISGARALLYGDEEETHGQLESQLSFPHPGSEDFSHGEEEHGDTSHQQGHYWQEGGPHGLQPLGPKGSSGGFQSGQHIHVRVTPGGTQVRTL